MKKYTFTVLTVSALCCASLATPESAVAQDRMSYAELFQPWPSGAGPVGPEPSVGHVVNVEGQEFIESITEVEIGKSPYPGIHIELEPQRPTYPDTRFQITASGGKIYPERFGIPFSVRINYKDGSFEYYTDEFDVWPLKALVADRPAEPVITETPYRTTVTTTVSAQPVTTTVSAQPVTTTVSAQPVTTTVSAQPVTTTVSAQPVTTTVSAQPVTTTVSAQPVTTTVSAQPVTTTVSAQPVTTTVSAQPVTTTRTQVEEAGSSTGRIVGVLLGVLAALGIGAGSMFFAFENGLL